MRADPELRRWIRSQPGWNVRPRWSEPSEARKALSTCRLRLLETFERRLRDAWSSDVPHLAGAEAFAALDPASRVAFYPSSPPGGPAWFVQSITSGAVSVGPLRHHEKLPSVRLYALDGDDPFADRPVSLPELARCASMRHNAVPFIESFLHPNDVHQQLRMVLYRSRKAVLYAGWYRRARERHFDADEHALLLAARPALARWQRVASTLGTGPFGDGAVVGALRAIANPALLVSGARILFANRHGESHVQRFRAWHGAGRPPGFADVTQLGRRGIHLELVLPHAEWRPAPAPLPPTLHRIAAAMAAGRGDADIARDLEIPIATVRTYASRVLRRLGLTDRRELIRRAPQLALGRRPR